jgi:ParB/RepB/Spo0J family partition protein
MYPTEAILGTVETVIGRGSLSWLHASPQGRHRAGTWIMAASRHDMSHGDGEEGEIVEIVDREVALEEIDETFGPQPSERLVENIRRNGVVVPVIVAERVDEHGAIRLQLVDGNRRVAAARAVEMETIPARVLQDVSEAEAANMTLLTNSFRTSNYITEFWAMNQLERAGVSRNRLAEFTGMSRSTLETRQLLANLDRRLFLGLSDGRIGPSIALAAARLDPDIQQELGDLYERTGRLTKAQVDAVTPKPEAEVPEELPPVNLEGRVLPSDLQFALVSVARQAIARGIDVETWVEAAGRAFGEAGT